MRNGISNLPTTTVRIDKDMRTEIDLMAGGLDVMSQIQIGRENGQVSCQRTLMLWQCPFAFTVAAAGAATASAGAATAGTTAAARRCSILRITVAAGTFVVRRQWIAVGQFGCLDGCITVVGLRQWARTACCVRCTSMMLQFWLRMALLRGKNRREDERAYYKWVSRLSSSINSSRKETSKDQIALVLLYGVTDKAANSVGQRPKRLINPQYHQGVMTSMARATS